MGLKNAKAIKRIRELGKQQLVSELGCVMEFKKRLGPNSHRMKCLFDTAGLGVVETNASKIDIDGPVKLEVVSASDGLLPLDGSPVEGADLSDLKGETRTHEGFKFVKSGLDSRGLEYSDNAGNKWQIPLIKENGMYNSKIVITPLEGNDHWCRVSAGLGGSKVIVGQKIKCDSRTHKDNSSIL